MGLSRRSGVSLLTVALLGLAACNGGGGSEATTSTPGVPDCNTTDDVDDPSVLNGVYELDWSYEDLAEASGLPQEDVEFNDGLFTIIFSDGCFNWVWEEDPEPCGGAYIVTGNRVSMVATLLRDDWDCGDDLLGDEVVDAAWELNDDQLTLSDFVPIQHLDDFVNDFFAVFFGTKPLIRVGEADGTIG
jgi:hypothetical protein